MKFKIKNELFGSELIVFVDTPEKNKKQMAKYGITEKEMEGQDGLFFDNGKGEYLMFLEKETNARIISHESCHYVFALLTNLGIPINEANDEVFAYLLGDVVEKITNKIQKAPHS